jgi:hypothetical protein
MIGVGIGIPFFKSFGGIDAQAQAHYNRVIADGGLVPSGLSGVNAFFNTIKTIYGTSDINTAISVGLDPQVLGYKLGAGSGTTLGQAAQKLYSPKDVFGGIGTGNAYWEGSGVAGNYVSTPNAAANQITGDIEIISKIDYKNNTTLQTIIDKSNGTAFNYSLYIDGSNVPKFIYSVLGSVQTAICSSNIGASFSGYIKVTRTFVNGVFKFFTSSDGITYTQLGTNISGTIGLLDSNSHPVTIGILQPSSFPFQGKIYRATLSNTIGGSPVVDFNPNQYTGANTWTSTTSEVWTVNRTGAGLADVVQTTAASQPLLLVHSGANYWFGSGVDGNYTQSSLQSTFNFGSNFSIVFEIEPRASTTGEFSGCLNGLFYTFALISSGIIRFNGGGQTINSTTPITFTRQWIRVSRSGSTWSFFTSLDRITWTSLGTATNAVILLGTPINIEVGRGSGGVGVAFAGKIHRALFYMDATVTTIVRDFNPSTYNAATSQTQWTSSTGEVWTLNVGTAATGYKGALVDRTIVQGDGVDDRLVVNSAFSLTSRTNYVAANLFSAAFQYVIDDTGGSIARNAVVKTGVSSQVGAYLNTTTTRTDSTFTININLITCQIATSQNQNIQVNNGAVTSNAGLTPSTITGLSVLTRADGGSPANAAIRTIIIAPSYDNSTVKTTMYNIIRSMSNNAF